MSRKSTIPLPSWWLERCNAWVAANRISRRELGVRLGHALHRKPYAHPLVGRYLDGENASLDLTDAFARLIRSAPPYRVHETPEEAAFVDALVHPGRNRMTRGEIALILRRLTRAVEDMVSD